MRVIQGILVFAVIASGTASQYGRGRMESTIAVRRTGRTAYTVPAILPANLDGFVAVEDCSRLGNIVYYQVVDPMSDCFPTCPVEKFLIVDCSGHQSTSAWMKRNTILCEVDYNTAIRWATLGYGIKVHELRLVRFVMSHTNNFIW